MEHRSFAPDIVVPNDDYACGNKRAGELAPDVAPEELRQEKQVGGPVNCSDSELCTFLLALEAGFLPTYYSDTNQSVQLKSMSIASKSYRRGKQTVLFHGFPSLQMSQNLTEDRGAELLTLFLAASRAKTLAQPEAGQDLTEHEADSGQKWRGSFAKYDHATRSWKTHQFSLLGDCTEFSETWPRWGSMRNGECWERTTSERPTEGNESGLWPTPKVERKVWPTPTVAMAKGSSGGALTRKTGKSRENDRLDYAVEGDAKNGRLNPTWVEWLMGWPLNWTSLDPLSYDAFIYWEVSHGKEQRQETGTTQGQGGNMRNVWWKFDPSASPQERGCDRQHAGEYCRSMSGVPHKDTPDDRDLGAREGKSSDVRSLRGDVQAETFAPCNAMRESGVCQGARPQIGKVEMGVKSRVDRVTALGNGQVPRVVAAAWRHLAPNAELRGAEPAGGASLSNAVFGVED